jgi:cytochrome c-type biogenesis protein CcmE
MKKSNIIFLVVIVVTIVMLVTTMENVGSYEAFSSEKTMAGQKVHVVGFYNKEKGVEYNPEVDPNSFRFYLADTLGMEKQVKCYKEVPQDFEKSERVVVIGQLRDDDIFHAEELLLKCPSKYVDENGVLREMPKENGGN